MFNSVITMRFFPNTILCAISIVCGILNTFLCMCEVSAVTSQISDCKPGGPGFNTRDGQGLNFARPCFATPGVDRDVKPLVYILSGDLEELTHLLIKIG